LSVPNALTWTRMRRQSVLCVGKPFEWLAHLVGALFSVLKQNWIFFSLAEARFLLPEKCFDNHHEATHPSYVNRCYPWISVVTMCDGLTVCSLPPKLLLTCNICA
jgi:hypothetical protein